MRIFKCVSFIETLKKLKRSLKFDCINFEFNFWHTFIRFTKDIQNFHQCLVNTISYCFYFLFSLPTKVWFERCSQKYFREINVYITNFVFWVKFLMKSKTIGIYFGGHYSERKTIHEHFEKEIWKNQILTWI